MHSMTGWPRQVESEIPAFLTTKHVLFQPFKTENDMFFQPYVKNHIGFPAY